MHKKGMTGEELSYEVIDSQKAPHKPEAMYFA